MRFSNSPDDLSMVAALKAMKILGLGGIIGGGGMTTIEILTVQMNKLSEIDMINQTFAAQFFISCRIPDGALDADLCNPSAELPMRSDGYPVHKPSAAWFITQFDFNNALSVSLLNEQVALLSTLPLLKRSVSRSLHAPTHATQPSTTHSRCAIALCPTVCALRC